jgi:uncharacterized protein
MGINIIDKRNNPKGKSSKNRHKLLKRISEKIKKAIPNIVKDNDVKDLTSSKKGVKIPIKGIGEPQFSYDQKSGNKKRVYPGNKEYGAGDRIRKPNDGEGKGGSKGSNDPSISEDEFVINISREEFLEYFFDDLELPDMVKKHLNTIVNFKQKRAGFSNQGTPNRLNVVKSFKNSLSRKMATSIFFDKKIKDLENKLKNKSLSENEIDALKKEIDKLKKMKLSISFMEEVDLQYNNFEKQPVPVTSAVMFCIMDVSGSMGEKEKDIAKRFFMLLYMFLTKQYENIELVFIRHHTAAKEVDEEEFFNSRETGGTIVLPALELMNSIIDERYSGWNVYTSQISDGDVWSQEDSSACKDVLENKILEKIQYMIYVEIPRAYHDSGDLWVDYKNLSNSRDNFAVGQIREVSQIWDVFKDFFKKRAE